MKKWFRRDSSAMERLSSLTDLMVLSILWLLCCLPVVTIGASTAAMYSVTFEMSRGDYGNTASRFFSAFRSSFKSGTMVLLLSALPVVFSTLLLLSMFSDIYPDAYVFKALLSGPAIAILLTQGYLFPLVSQFECGCLTAYKQSFLLMAGNLLISLLIALIRVLPLLLTLFFPVLFLRTFFLWLLFGPALSARIITIFLKKVFRPLRQEEASTENAEEESP